MTPLEERGRGLAQLIRAAQKRESLLPSAALIRAKEALIEAEDSEIKIRVLRTPIPKECMKG